jgi:agmatine/peptidylarginine deiminase
LANGTVFVPQFGIATDAEALRVYSQTGLKVIPVPNAKMSDVGRGNLHCMSMTYPAASLQQSLTHPDFLEWAK